MGNDNPFQQNADSFLMEKKEVKQSAVAAMENCLAYVATGDLKRALMAYGESAVWNEFLADFECDLCEENEHFREMCEIAEATFAKTEVRATPS